jgi:hypothetical protein
MKLPRAWLIGAACSWFLGAGVAYAEPAPVSRIYAGTVVLGRNQPMHAVDVIGAGWGMSYRDSELDVSEGLAAFGLRVRPTEGLWLEAGVGAASTRASVTIEQYQDAVESGVVPAGMAGLGVELELLGVPLAVTMHVGTGVDGTGAACAHHASMGVGGTW